MVDESWLQNVRAGNPSEIQRLWEVFFPRMVGLARTRLQGANRAVHDEEDVALSAFKSFCLGAQAGKFSQLTDQDSLWSLLVSLTLHKAIDRIRYDRRQKRASVQDVNIAHVAEEVLSSEPSPEFLADFNRRICAIAQRVGRCGRPGTVSDRDREDVGRIE